MKAEHKRVTIHGRRKGYKSASVIVSPDGSMFRGDVDLDIAIGLRTLSDAARVVGMTRDEFMAERDALRKGDHR